MACAGTCRCGCCEGTSPITPRAIHNRPGLDTLAVRIGEHGSFLETMQARLSSAEFPALVSLGARTTEDPAIALLDAWATVGDVLTFYQERLANEGYLRTATERRSVAELANLVGYAPRPGVSATTYLAFEIDRNASEPVTIPTGTKVQSVPGPGEQPATFETDHDILARREWNAIRPRLEQPQSLASIRYGSDEAPGSRVWLSGITTRLAPGDPLLVQGGEAMPQLMRVTEVIADPPTDRTLVRFTTWNGEDVYVPATTAVRRALLTARKSPSTALPKGSPARQAVEAIDAFLSWLAAQLAADPLEPDVETVVEEQHIIPRLADTMLLARSRIVEVAGDAVLSASLKHAGSEIASFANNVIEEHTGLEDGGLIGRQTTALGEFIGSLSGEWPGGGVTDDERVSAQLKGVVGRLAAERSVPPRNAEALVREPAVLFEPRSDLGTQAVAALEPRVARELANAIASASVAAAVPVRVWALRHRALLFGASAPRRIASVNSDTGALLTEEWTDADIIAEENTGRVDLEAPHEGIVPGDWVVLDYSAVDTFGLGRVKLPNTDGGLLIGRAWAVQPKVARASYSLSGQTTRITLADAQGQGSLQWFSFEAPVVTAVSQTSNAFKLIRNLSIMTQGEELALAPEPIEAEICGGDDWIETDALYTGLETGRWLVVSGERSDVPGSEGVQGQELAMLAAVRQDVRRSEGGERFEAGEVLHSFIKLAAPLSYCYRRGSVAINANVAKASHGDSRAEVLGGGDASKPLQSFTLRQPPLTYVPANEPDGIASTLHIHVNGAEWREAEAMVALGPTGRGFVTQAHEDGSVSVTFGNGVNGARLPTGQANVTARYRSGIGKGGNVRPGQLSQLMTRPYGVQAVINPIEAAGGADRESRDQVRENASLRVMALDRLVGPQDYADFSRTFAGIAKAASARIFTGGASAMHVTIAGVEDTAIPESSDLYRNLLAALRTYGDPALPVQLAMRELLMLVLAARLAPDPAYQWEDVVARVRSALLHHFGFERRKLGQPVVLSEVVALIQSQRGVLYVDVEALGAVSQLDEERERRSPQEIGEALSAIIADASERGRPDDYVKVLGIRAAPRERGAGAVLPAQLAIFVPSLPETLILNRIDAA